MLHKVYEYFRKRMVPNVHMLGIKGSKQAYEHKVGRVHDNNRVVQSIWMGP